MSLFNPLRLLRPTSPPIQTAGLSATSVNPSLTSTLAVSSSTDAATDESSIHAASSHERTRSLSLRNPGPSSLFARKDNLIVGTRVIIVQDADLRGEISIGSGTVIHPKATILALQGPISIGCNCIIEETVVIVNRNSSLMKIGDDNLFEVGCRIEAKSIGSNNVFEVRSKVAQTISIGSFCTVGAGCTVVPQPLFGVNIQDVFDDEDQEEGGVEQEGVVKKEGGSTETQDESAPRSGVEELPDRTVVYGYKNKRRLWSGEGVQQQAALHAKHLEYLRETLPKIHKLKIIQGVRAPSSTTSS